MSSFESRNSQLCSPKETRLGQQLVMMAMALVSISVGKAMKRCSTLELPKPCDLGRNSSHVVFLSALSNRFLGGSGSHLAVATTGLGYGAFDSGF